MKLGFAKKIVCLLAAAVSLASCDFMSIFGGGSSSEEVKDHPYSGHYLFDIYEPTQNKNPGVYYAHGDNTLTMDNEPRYECFLFKTGDEDTSVTFNLEKGKYKSLCFIAGLAENHFTHYDFEDKGALSIWDGSKKLYEEMYYALGPSRYVSIDVSNAESITFFMSHIYSFDCFGIGEVTLWEDANHSIEPEIERAKENEDFLDHTYFVYGDGTNGADDWGSLDDGGDGYTILEKEEKYCYVNNQKITKGIAFTTSSWYDEKDCKKFVINALGRYKYLHFNLGHIDQSTHDGSIYLRVSVDRQVKLLQLATDEDLPFDITIPLNYGKIVNFEIFPDPQDKTRTDLFSYGSYCVYNMVGSPNEDFPASGDEKEYKGSYKLISEVGLPYSFTNAFSNESSILTGKTAYAGIQMGGILYSEGLLLKSIFNMMTTTVEQMPARASFDLHKAFRYLTFKVGRRDRSALVSEKLNVYLDGDLKESYTLNSTGAVTEYAITVTNARTCTFEIVGVPDTYRGQYGIVDIGVHTDQIRELPFDHTPNGTRAAADSYASGEQVRMMRDLRPYDSFSGANEQDILTDDRRDTAEYYTNDGRSFVAGGESRNEGFILKTGTYMSLGGGAAASAMLCMAVGFVLLVPLGAQDVNCSSVALFNLRDKFASMTFKVAPLTIEGKTEYLSIITPNGVVKKTALDPYSETTITVNMDGVSEFAFFLEFNESESVGYGFYDLVLTAK